MSAQLLQAGQQLSHYQIERLLGAGGMGEVYLATDRALGRKVALKILPDRAGPDAKARAVREARANAQLQHAGIATFFESGEVSGTTFIAMEYVAGETLRQRLGAGAFAVGDVVSFVDAVLAALGHAHAVGLLHRDIKPENIMLTKDGSVKLLDFGLAKPVLQAADGVADTEAVLTEPDQLLGTMAYMSPEQLRGEDLSPASDLFSVGIVLHECLGGRHPFAAKTRAEMAAALLSDRPLPLAASGIPEQLRRIVSRTLAKDVTDRYASTAELLSDLRSLELGTGDGSYAATLAIFNLDNRSGDERDDWVGVGIAESVARDIARAGDLIVVPREEVLQVRADEPDDDAAGRSLGCRWTLSGHYEKTADTIQIEARIGDVATAKVLATETMEGALADIFQMQHDLADGTLRSLNRLAPSRPAGALQHNLEAHECTTRGFDELYRMGKDSIHAAMVYFEHAIELEPEHAPALTGLAAVTALRFTFSTDSSELATAEELLRRVSALQPHDPDTLMWTGYVAFRQSRLDEAARYISQAIEMTRERAQVFYFAGCIASAQGRVAEALAHYQSAVDLAAHRPRSVRIHAWQWLGLGWSHLDLENFAEAVWCMRRATDMSSAWAGGYLGECLRRAGMLDEARDQFIRSLEDVEGSDHVYRDTTRAVCLVSLGRTASQQADQEAAVAGFRQAEQHLRGRARALGGGHLLVQALAGLARASGDVASYEQARDLFDKREGFDFTWLWMCTDDVTLFELARAANAVGREADARALRQRALEAGSVEARVQ